MTTELWMLTASVGVLLGIILAQSFVTATSFGLRKVVGTREDIPFPQPGVGGRIYRALVNHMEAMLMFAPLVLIAHVQGVSTPLTEFGAQLFVGARALHAVVYLLGVPVIRSLVFGAGLAGIGMIAFEVVRAGLG